MPHVTERTRLDLILAADNLLHLGSLIGEDDTRGRTLRALARRRDRVADRAYGRLADPGRGQNVPETPSQSSGPYRPTQQGAHRR